jgi:hypothetical protein
MNVKVRFPISEIFQYCIIYLGVTVTNYFTQCKHKTQIFFFLVIGIKSKIHAVPPSRDKLHSYIKRNSSIDIFSLMSEIISTVIKFSRFEPYFPKVRQRR